LQTLSALPSLKSAIHCVNALLISAAAVALVPQAAIGASRKAIAAK